MLSNLEIFDHELFVAPIRRADSDLSFSIAIETAMVEFGSFHVPSIDAKSERLIVFAPY